ncbi:DUF2189 domain-containing protein [Altererythrobacter arenosus]|uniref:DUF2189 domain-containing protein n=1 Tax=Altererythrobacter arenosus TaxID=3032592 RepID=A0ABY8FY43_9SPHN|nr:DUF2189 domain-containing protein [Altererythrobacter sp. CAU 1644]WFL78201.1 DUF2189 domain-containing protein [Altererythrobacter sp. CAU 1644]
MSALARNRVGQYEVASDLSFGDLSAAVAAGWRDFRAAPLYGLFFAAIFAAAGIGLSYYFYNRGELAWLIAAAAGFPLLAPFAAAGLYEVSRRRLSGDSIGWGPVLGAVKAGDGQLPVMGVIAFVIFAFWVILAHTVFGVFLGQSGLGATPLQTLLTPAGLGMLGVGSAIGGIVALFLFAITVVSLPMLIDREVDFITAIIVSVRVVQLNTFLMLSWAVIIALLAFAAMAPAFVGLLVVLPLLGHATFHLYRRAVR